jgi:hypothetical protein
MMLALVFANALRLVWRAVWPNRGLFEACPYWLAGLLIVAR